MVFCHVPVGTGIRPRTMHSALSGESRSLGSGTIGFRVAFPDNMAHAGRGREI